jgi:hypothetical protein
LHTPFGREKITLIWDNLPSHKFKAMKASIATKTGWLRAERLPGYAHDINRSSRCGATPNRLSWPTSAPTHIEKAHAAAESDLQHVGSSYDLCFTSSPTPAFPMTARQPITETSLGETGRHPRSTRSTAATNSGTRDIRVANKSVSSFA